MSFALPALTAFVGLNEARKSTLFARFQKTGQGAVSVRTAAGTSRSAVVFTPTVLASVAVRAGRVTPSPNPAATSFRVPGLAAGSSVRLVDALGRVAR